MSGSTGCRPGEELVYECEFRFIPQFAGITLSHYAFCGLVQNDALVGNEENAGQFVCDNHNRDTQVVAESQDELVKLNCSYRVETGGGFVKEQEIGLEHQRTGNASTLLHATRDFTWQVLGEWTQPDKVEFGLYKLLHDFASDRSPRSERERKVFSKCHRAEERTRLKEYAEARDSFITVRISNAVDVNFPGLRLFEPDQMAQQRALAASRSTENRKYGSTLDLKRDVLHQHMCPPPHFQIGDGNVWL
jgi:hypothetical protein